jgi:ABC-type Fe3+-hydroxamate transport system substrate-binding protein
LDFAGLVAAAPDVIVLTETCPVCTAAYEPAVPAEAGVAAARGRIGSTAVRLISVATGGLDGAVGLIEPLAAELGEPNRGAALFKTRAARLLALRMHVARFLVLSGAARPGVALVAAPETTGGSMPWLLDMIDAAGGIAISGTGTEGHPFERQPDVLLVAASAAWEGNVETGSGHRLTGSGSWRDLPAVHSGRAWLVCLEPDFTHYGPRLVEGVETLVRILFPQALGANGTPPAPHLARQLE